MTTRRQIKRKVGLAIVAIAIFSFPQSIVAEKQSNALELINLAGEQRMLSQRISKDYLYKGGEIAVSKADRQLNKTLKESLQAHNKLKESITDPKILNLLGFVEMNNQDIVLKTKESFTIDNAQYVLDLSESMLEGNEFVMSSLKKSSGLDASKLIDMSARQAMLSQRIAKYYIAYQLGIKDKNTINQMNKAVKLFADSHKALLANQTNTPEINGKLKKIDRLWGVVYKFYLDIETGGLPLIVFNTTDDITKKMDEVTALYVKIK